MKIAVISFTGGGSKVNHVLCRALRRAGHEVRGYEKRAGSRTAAGEEELLPVSDSLAEWTKAQFASQDGLIFVGACGIAVRAIAPYVQDKFKDPAVVVIDEKAGHAVSLLSGHVGGANALTQLAAAATGAEPVISTATDVNGLFAVDVFAVKNHLAISDRTLAKEVSAAILAGKRIPFYTEFKVQGKLPDELDEMEPEAFLQAEGIKTAVSIRPFEPERRTRQEASGNRTLYLIPSCVAVGMGCRKEASPECVRDLYEKTMSEQRIFPEAVKGLYSIDLKQNEAALVRLAASHQIPFQCYSSEELMAQPGEFTGSEFVKQVTGCDCICERAACAGSLGGSLICRKRKGEQSTIALAMEDVILNV